MDIGPVEGMSGNGSITLRSHEFMASAKLLKDGRIECKSKRLSRLSRFLYRHPNFPLIRTVRTDLRIISIMGKKEVAVLLIFLAIVSALLVIVSNSENADSFESKVNNIFIFSELRNVISFKKESQTKIRLPTQGLEFSRN